VKRDTQRNPRAKPTATDSPLHADLNPLTHPGNPNNSLFLLSFLQNPLSRSWLPRSAAVLPIFASLTPIASLVDDSSRPLIISHSSFQHHKTTNFQHLIPQNLKSISLSSSIRRIINYRLHHGTPRRWRVPGAQTAGPKPLQRRKWTNPTISSHFLTQFSVSHAPSRR